MTITVKLGYTEREAREVVRCLAYFDSNVTATYEDHDRMGLIRSAIEQELPKPRPEEPLGLGAVVEDAEGVRWVRTHDTLAPWLRHNFSGSRYWDGLTEPRVLSHGWTGDEA